MAIRLAERRDGSARNNPLESSNSRRVHFYILLVT